MTRNNFAELEKRLWDAADELRANSKLKSSEYSTPVPGLIFLRYAEHKFSHAEKQLAALEFVVPPVALQDRFASLLEPMTNLATNLRRKNANLRRTRDLLL